MDTRRQLTRARWVAVAVLVGALAACGSSTSKVSAQTLLQRAKSKADASSSVHFHLTSSKVATSGTNLTAGDGDLERPDAIQGSFTVLISGFGANVKVVSKSGVFEALLPFAKGYVKTNPSSFGLTDPAQLLDPSHGLTSLLAQAQNPKLTGQTRLSGELLDTVTFTVPGTTIPVLPDSNPSKPVTLVVAINPANYELRQITLTGPLTTAAYNSTFVVTLTKYNEQVNITLPSTS